MAPRQIVERAEAYVVQTQLVGNIALRQLCDITGVSERTLRNAFYDVRGVSPTQSMRRMRLNQVHAALKHSDQHATVTEVATRYGFYELGRFAQRYKAVFGEHPSETLRATNDADTHWGESQGAARRQQVADRLQSPYPADVRHDRSWAAPLGIPCPDRVEPAVAQRTHAESA